MRFNFNFTHDSCMQFRADTIQFRVTYKEYKHRRLPKKVQFVSHKKVCHQYRKSYSKDNGRIFVKYTLSPNDVNFRYI